MPLLAPSDPYCLLENGRTGQLFETPKRWIRAESAQDVAAALQEVEAEAARGHYCAGYMRYEAGAAFHDVDIHQENGSLLCFGVFSAPQVLTGADLDRFWAEKALISPSCTQARAAARWSGDEYTRKVEAILEHLAAGDIYQANLTFPLDLDVDGSAEALFARLRQNQPAQYSAFIAFEDDLVLSVSPERFFTLQDERFEAQPMKGTAPATSTGNARALRQDPKNRAENLMITDLLRNDLSQIAAPASVETPALFEIEHLPSVYQMTSRVTAVRREGIDLSDIMTALFPCGSITGAPKRSAMRIIAAQEDDARGIYCGAIGLVEPRGNMRFSVPIRTIVQTGGKAQLRVGSGIVADSTPASEYAECLLKADFLNAGRPAFSLIETIGYDTNAAARPQPDLWPYHFDRLTKAAGYFQFPAPSEDIAKQLDALKQSLPPGRYKIRIVYSKHGEVSVTASPLPETPGDRPLRIALGTLRTPPPAEFLRYKTTNRAAYHDALAKAEGETACDEVFLIDAQGRLTEGSYTNIFIKRGDTLLTPKETGAFLPGVYRAYLLETGRAREATLTPSDLRSPDAIYAGNSVRGLIPAVLAPDGPANTS